MRLIHTSDWHLGRRLHGQDLLEAQSAFLEWLVALAAAEAADAVLVSGDVYDRAQPPADAVAVLDRTLADFSAAGIPLILSSGNHDSAVRLQYGGAVFEQSGIHVRTDVAQVTSPVLLQDPCGPVAVYAIPYVLPDMVLAEQEAEHSRTAVLGTLTERIRADADSRGVERVVVMAHAFVHGAAACDSEREIRVGGIGDTPSDAFAGFSYVALGHLHGPQEVRLAGSSTVLTYSGSPLAFSFSERDHTKSVTVVDIDSQGAVTLRRVPTPVPRPLRQVTGRLSDLVSRADGDLAELASAWVKVVLTDPGRMVNPMERLRQVWPHTLVLEFAPERSAGPPAALPAGADRDPVEVCTGFVTEVSGAAPSPAQLEALRQAVLAAQRAEAVA